MLIIKLINTKQDSKHFHFLTFTYEIILFPKKEKTATALNLRKLSFLSTLFFFLSTTLNILHVPHITTASRLIAHNQAKKKKEKRTVTVLFTHGWQTIYSCFE